jgi:hypothetical protein
MINKPAINKKKRVFFSLFTFPLVFLFILVLPSLVSAQDPITNPALNISLTSLSGSEFFSGLVSALLTLFFVIGAIVFVFIIVIGAVGWISSGGDKVANENARKKITNAAIGLVILFSLFAVINLIEYFFGTDITSFNITDISIPPTTPGAPTPTVPPAVSCEDRCAPASYACRPSSEGCETDETQDGFCGASIYVYCCCGPAPTATTAPTATPTTATVVFNSLGRCDDICDGLSLNCLQVGIDDNATYDNYAYSQGPGNCYTGPATCSTLISNQGGTTCYGHETMWTRCRCIQGD